MKRWLCALLALLLVFSLAGCQFVIDVAEVLLEEDPGETTANLVITPQNTTPKATTPKATSPKATTPKPLPASPARTSWTKTATIIPKRM